MAADNIRTVKKRTNIGTDVFRYTDTISDREYMASDTYIQYDYSYQCVVLEYEILSTISLYSSIL